MVQYLQILSTHFTLRSVLGLAIVAGLFATLPPTAFSQSLPPQIKERLEKLTLRLDKMSDKEEINGIVQKFIERAPSEQSRIAAIQFMIGRTKSDTVKSALQSLKKSTAGKKKPSSETIKKSSRTFALKNVNFLDGQNPLKPNTILIFNEQKITHILDSSEEEKIPSAAKIFDMNGAYITPGLSDVHVHMATNPSSPSERPEKALRSLRRMLGSGITAVRDMGGDGRVLTFYGRQMKLGDELGPDVFFSTILAGPRFFTDRRVRAASRGTKLGAGAWAHQVTDKTDLKALIQRVKGIGSTGVKLYFDIDQELAGRIAKEAKKEGVQVWSHWRITPSTELETIEAGIEVVSHASFIGRPVRGAKTKNQSLSETIPEIMRANNLDLILKRMRDKGAILDPTLAVIDSMGERKKANRPSAIEICAAVTNKALRSGVRVAAGSDSHGNDEVCGGHIEFRLLHNKARMSAAEVLNSATVVNAEVLGKGESIGQLKAGKLPTFLVFDSNPLDSVKSWAKPKFVVKRGKIYVGDDLRDLDKKVRPVGSFK